MTKILVTDGMDKSAVEELQNLGFDVTLKFFEPDDLGIALKDFDCVVIRSATKIKKPIIDAALGGNLKLIIRAGVGIDNIDHVYAQEKGIKVMNTPNSSSASVAELAIGHMFSVARFIGISNATMRNGQWNKKHYTGIELAGKVLGLIGFGRIAIETAKKAHALGMQIVYSNRSGEKEGYPDYKHMDLDDLLKISDFVSLHIPFDKIKGATIGERELDLMKKGSVLINCARGGVVDEAALLKALESGKLYGAGIDVFEEEPTKNQALVEHPRVSVTPHTGASTGEAQERIGIETLNVIKDFFK